MKKLMFGLSVAVAAGAMAIESANVVGYSTKAAEQGKFIILGAQFDQVDGSKALNGLITGVEGVAYDDDNLFKTTAAQVQIPNSTGGYNTYFYLSDGWFDDNGKDGYKPGWCDAAGVLVDDELIPSIAQWLRSTPGNAIANVAGAVPEDASVSVSCPAVFALRANAYPVPVVLNSDTMTSADIVGVAYDDNNAFKTTAPQLQVPNVTGGYNTYFYLTDGWYDNNGADGYKPGWCDAAGVLVDDAIPVAQGFWTKGVTGAFTLTFTK